MHDESRIALARIVVAAAIATCLVAGCANPSQETADSGGGASNTPGDDAGGRSDATVRGASAVTASVDVGKAVASASAVYLQGPALDAKAGLRLAGTGISPKGDWAPNAPWALPVSGNVVTVVVPPASAALVHAL